MFATAAILEVFILNLLISKWWISKIGLLQECLAVRIQKIPKKLNGTKLTPSLNMAQEISWLVSFVPRAFLARLFEVPTSPF